MIFPLAPSIVDLPLSGSSCRDPARSGTKVLASGYLPNEFDPEPLTMVFPFGVSEVSAFVGNPRYPDSGPDLEMVAYDRETGGNVVSTASVSLRIGCSGFHLRMGVSEPNNQPIIRRVELKSVGPSEFEFIDDLSFESEAEPPPTALEPPRVTITARILAPTPGNSSRALVTGTITGEGLYVNYVPPKLEHQWPVDKNSVAVSSSKEDLVPGSSLFGSPPSLTFSIEKDLDDFGTNTFIVSAFNAAGTGSAHASVVYLPDCVVQELSSNPSKYGRFRYGRDLSGCQTAVFQSGAIFCTAAGTFSTTGAIFTQWEVENPGCATGAERTVPMDACAVIGGARSQDFVDWDIFVAPDPPFMDRLQAPHPIHSRRPDVEVEYEWCLIAWPLPKDDASAQPGIIEKGDKIYLAGRFVADCGHDDPYHTEIHPPAAMITAHTGSGVFGAETRADILYFDWWYQGQTAEFDLYPPPRLSPDALPSFSSPVWVNLCKRDGGKCGIESELLPKSAPNHLHIQISGRPDARPGKEDSTCQLHYGHNPCCCNLFKCGSAKRPVYVNVTRPIVGSFLLGWNPRSP